LGQQFESDLALLHPRSQSRRFKTAALAAKLFRLRNPAHVNGGLSSRRSFARRRGRCEWVLSLQSSRSAFWLKLGMPPPQLFAVPGNLRIGGHDWRLWPRIDDDSSVIRLAEQLFDHLQQLCHSYCAGDDQYYGDCASIGRPRASSFASFDRSGSIVKFTCAIGGMTACTLSSARMPTVTVSPCWPVAPLGNPAAPSEAKRYEMFGVSA
jgi:hypothetical protein